MLLKCENCGRPVETWSPTGQRLHHLIGLLPVTQQAFLFLMSLKAERHLTCMPTPRALLISTAQKKRQMSIHLAGVAVWHLHVVTSSAGNSDLEDSEKQKCRLWTFAVSERERATPATKLLQSSLIKNDASSQNIPLKFCCLQWKVAYFRHSAKSHFILLYFLSFCWAEFILFLLRLI